jgi:AcrR family transcriptional regulator
MPPMTAATDMVPTSMEPTSTEPASTEPDSAPSAPPATAPPATAPPATAPVSRVPAPRRPGRPRSEQADQAIIEATLEVFAECGPDGLGIEQVAARAGVGKATIYRRWPGKEELLLEAIGALRTELPHPQGRSVRADLAAVVEALCQESVDPRRARQFALLHGDGVRYPRLLARYNQVVMEPRRELIRSVLRRGLGTGELREDADVEVATFLLSGAVLARGGYAAEPSDAKYARRVVEELLRGLAAR